MDRMFSGVACFSPLVKRIYREQWVQHGGRMSATEDEESRADYYICSGAEDPWVSGLTAQSVAAVHPSWISDAVSAGYMRPFSNYILDEDSEPDRRCAPQNAEPTNQSPTAHADRNLKRPRVSDSAFSAFSVETRAHKRARFYSDAEEDTLVAHTKEQDDKHHYDVRLHGVSTVESRPSKDDSISNTGLTSLLKTEEEAKSTRPSEVTLSAPRPSAIHAAFWTGTTSWTMPVRLSVDIILNSLEGASDGLDLDETALFVPGKECTGMMFSVRKRA